MGKVTAAVCAFMLLTPNASAQSAVLAFTGATLARTDGSPPLADSVILVEGKRIRSVAGAGEAQIPPDANRIDLRGKWVIPGLIDSHVHFFQSGGLYTRPDAIDLRQRVPYAEEEISRIRARLLDVFARYIRCGITSVADVGGPFWNFEVRQKAAETPLAPRVSVAGPLISTYQPEQLTTDDPPIIRVNTPDEAVALVRREAERQPDFIKIWYIVGSGQAAEQHLPIVRAAIEEAHRHKLPAAVHATELETARLAVQAGADILVHSVFDREVDDAFVSLLKQRSVVYVPTLVVDEGYKEVFRQQIRLTPPEHRFADPYVVSSLFDLRHIPPQELPARIVASMVEGKPVEPAKTAQRNLKRLVDAGVAVAAGSDAGNIGTLHGPALFREFELMDEAGLTPAQILHAATAGGARLLGRSDQLGSVEPGKLADFVILNSDPLADIRNAADIHAVVKDGRLYQASAILRETAADVVQRQVNAYNARDLEAFVASYAEDATLYDFPGEVIGSGREFLRAQYGRLFSDAPKLHAEIANRIAVGPYVIDQERVTGLPEGEVLEAIAIYEVRDGLIRKVWFTGE